MVSMTRSSLEDAVSSSATSVELHAQLADVGDLEEVEQEGCAMLCMCAKRAAGIASAL